MSEHLVDNCTVSSEVAITGVLYNVHVYPFQDQSSGSDTLNIEEELPTLNIQTRHGYK
jgi:hypothetical protein